MRVLYVLSRKNVLVKNEAFLSFSLSMKGLHWKRKLQPCALSFQEQERVLWLSVKNLTRRKIKPDTLFPHRVEFIQGL